MAYNRNITAEDKVFYDTDQLLSFTIYTGNPTTADILAGNAVPEDVSGWEIGFTFRKAAKTADPPLIEKSISGGGVAITGVYNADPNTNTQRVEVTLEDTDTYDPSVSPIVSIKPGTYAYGLKRLDPGEETMLTWGSFVLLQAAPWE